MLNVKAPIEYNDANGLILLLISCFILKRWISQLIMLDYAQKLKEKKFILFLIFFLFKKYKFMFLRCNKKTPHNKNCI